MLNMFEKNRGFTLIEMILVMVITGIIGGMVAVFIRAPVQGYMDSSRRAEMTDIADTALRRLARDIRMAVPNSVRVPAAACIATAIVPCFVEYLPTRVGGRYRAGLPGNILNFGAPGGTFTFDIIGPPIDFLANDFIVVGSQQSNGNPPYNQTAAGVLRAYAGGVGPQAIVTFNPIELPVWAEVQGHRFDVVDGAQQAVTYACMGVGINGNGDGTGTLNRYAAYGFRVGQAAPAALGVVPDVLADRLSACTIAYNPLNQRNGLVEITLTITRANESINLSHAVHVNNVP